MNISDIIMLVTLIVALIAVINEKNRGHLTLKLRFIDYFIFFVSFLLVNYFVFHDGFYNRGIYVEELYFEAGIAPKNWSYIISLLCLTYLSYKIWSSFFSRGRYDEVHKFYTAQIENSEITFLLDLIERYHKADIIRSIEKGIISPINGESDFMEDYNKRSFKEQIGELFNDFIANCFPTSWANRKIYAIYTLNSILNNPAFIPLSANLRPYLYADIIKHFTKNKRTFFPDDLVNSFLTELINQKSFWLKKELVASQNHDYGQPIRFFEENRILGSLLEDLSVSDVNSVWQSFGDIACDEIENERTLGIRSKLLDEFLDEKYLWDYKVFGSIVFFKILIIEAIIKNYKGCHFFINYYQHITSEILETFDKFHPNDFENVISNHHKLIEIMLSNLEFFLELANTKVNDGIYIDILSCLGLLMDDLTKNAYYGEKRKTEFLENILDLYCSLVENEQTSNMRTKMEDILLKPCILTKSGDPYYTYLKIAWDKLDKIKHRNAAGDYEYFTRLKNNIVVPLRL